MKKRENSFWVHHTSEGKLHDFPSSAAKGWLQQVLFLILPSSPRTWKVHVFYCAKNSERRQVCYCTGHLLCVGMHESWMNTWLKGTANLKIWQASKCYCILSTASENYFSLTLSNQGWQWSQHPLDNHRKTTTPQTFQENRLSSFVWGLLAQCRIHKHIMDKV